jgi:hypothetical protein
MRREFELVVCLFHWRCLACFAGDPLFIARETRERTRKMEEGVTKPAVSIFVCLA